jgi:hypothetical protein
MIDIGFEWTRGLDYEWVEEDGARIIRQVEVPGIKRQTQKDEPLRYTTKPLYMRFADLDGSADACVGFARAYGLLKTRASTKASERLDDWQREIRKMRGSRTALKATDEEPGGIARTANWARTRLRMTSIDVALLSGLSDAQGNNFSRPTLVLQPQNLLDGMYLQLAKFVAGDGSLQVCKQCGEWFERGATESRRSIAIFCSEKCKNRFHYLERAKR